MTRFGRWAKWPFLFALFLFAASLQAQWTEGTIAGTVSDVSGAGVVGAVVRIVNQQTGHVDETKTDDIGFYRVPHLQSGNYQVRIEAKGFKVSIVDNVVVNVANTTRTDAKLQVGAVQETIEVSGGAPLVQTEEGRLAATLDHREVQELPLNGREVYQLAVLQPGVTATNSPVVSNTASPNSPVTFDNGFISNGSTPRGNNFLLDGNTNNNEWLGGTPVIFPSVDAIQELQVQTLNFSAEYGRNNGAIVNVITRSGGNNLHGSTFYFHRNTALNASNFFDRQQKSPLLQHLFGFSLGGPIVKGKTFFFVDYEGSRRKDGQPSLVTVETPDFRAQVHALRPGSLADLFFTNFPGPTCAGNARDIGSIIAPDPILGPFTGAGALDGMNDVCDATPAQVQASRADQYLVRLDHQFSDKNRVFVRWVANDAFAEVGRQELFGEASVRGFKAPLNGYFADLGADYTHQFSTSWLNDFRFAYSRNHGVVTFDVPAGTVRDQLVSAGTPDFFAHLSFDDGLAGMGGPVYIPRDILFNTYSYADTMFSTLKRHALKYGFEARNIRESSNYQLETRPFIEFNSMFDFANDMPWLEEALANRDPSSSNFGNFSGTPRKFSWWQWALFLQDDWKVAQHLTLNLGLRYEVFQNPTESQGRLSNIVLGSGSDLAHQIAGATVARVKQLFKTDRNNFAPRVGLAWDPTGKGKTAVRSGFSVAYVEPFSNLYTNSSRFNPPDATFLDVYPYYGVGTDINYQFPFQPSPDFKNPVTANGGAEGLTIAPNGILPNLRSGYSMQWFLGFQQQFLNSYAVSANYVGTRALKLYTRSDPNRFTGDICNANTCDFTIDRLNPGWGQLYYITNGSNSTYHGLNVEVRKNYSHGVLLVGNYTLGKVIDLGSDAGLADYRNTSQPQYITQSDTLNPRLDRGPSEFDVKQRLTLLGLWNLPSPKKNGRAQKILGGWQYNWIVALQSGRPFSVYCSLPWFDGCDFNMDADQNDRPNRPANLKTTGFSKSQFVNGVFGDPERDTVHPGITSPAIRTFCPALVAFYVDTPCVPVGTNGNVGRNVFRGPMFASADMAFFKNTQITERLKIQFRTEMFNTFNHTNLYQPVGDMGSPQFGQSTTAFAARQIQFGLKFLF